MTIRDVALHLNVGWDLIKDIQKRDLSRRYAKPKLKHLRNIAIDEIAIAKGHRYLTVVMDLESGAVVFVGDGGGKALAVKEPVRGQVRVARFIAGLFRRGVQLHAELRPAWVNGQPGGLALDPEGRVISVFTLDIADGAVQAIRSVVNPDKLGHLGPVSDLARLPGKGR